MVLSNNSFKAKFYGKVYDIVPTKIIKKKVKSHWDFNGYEVEGHTIKTQQYGMFLDGEQVCRVKFQNGKYLLFGNHNGKCIGSISPLYEETTNEL